MVLRISKGHSMHRIDSRIKGLCEIECVMHYMKLRFGHGLIAYDLQPLQC